MTFLSKSMSKNVFIEFLSESFQHVFPFSQTCQQVILYHWLPRCFQLNWRINEASCLPVEMFLCCRWRLSSICLLFHCPAQRYWCRCEEHVHHLSAVFNTLIPKQNVNSCLTYSVLLLPDIFNTIFKEMQHFLNKFTEISIFSDDWQLSVKS